MCVCVCVCPTMFSSEPSCCNPASAGRMVGLTQDDLDAIVAFLRGPHRCLTVLSSAPDADHIRDEKAEPWCARTCPNFALTLMAHTVSPYPPVHSPCDGFSCLSRAAGMAACGADCLLPLNSLTACYCVFHCPCHAAAYDERPTIVVAHRSLSPCSSGG